MSGSKSYFITMDANKSAVAVVKNYQNSNAAFGMFSAIYMISSIYDREITNQTTTQIANGIEEILVASISENYLARMMASKFKGEWTEGRGGFRFEQPEKRNRQVEVPI